MGERRSGRALKRWMVVALVVGDRIYPPLAHPGRGMGNAEGEGSQIRTSNIQPRTSNIQHPTPNIQHRTSNTSGVCPHPQFNP